MLIGINAIEITAHSNKELASATWKKHFGFHPLRAFIDGPNACYPITRHPAG